MKPTLQQIAIAEACGLLNVRIERDYYGDPVLVADAGGGCGLVPDYLHDLNAMHQAEDKIALPWNEEYGRLLAKITVPDLELYEDGPIYGSTVMLLARATAAKRAEAFLRTIGKWEDSA